MKAMFLAFLSVGVVAVAADQILHRVGFSAKEQTSSSNVRLD